MPELRTVRDLRRAQIVAEARRLVAAEGMAGLTIAALEARLPFSRGVITHHFADKEDIVGAVLDSAVDEIDRATAAGVAASATFADKLAAVLRSKVEGFLAHPEATRILISFWGRLGTDPRARQRNAALFRRYRRQGERLLEEGRRAGVVAADVDVAGAAALLVGQVIGIVEQAVFDPGVDAGAAMREAVAAMAARVAPRPAATAPRLRRGQAR